MATMFAKSTLTVWNNAASGGWSNTSGGADNGTFPSATTDVVFDSNSGTARSITITDGAASTLIPCKTLTTLAANAMTFNGGSVALNPRGDVDLTGSNWTGPISYGGVVSSNFKAGNSVITTFANNGAAITLGAAIVISGALTLNASFNANNFNFTGASVAYVAGAVTITMGSGTWTLTGAGTIIWDAGSATITPGTSTIKATGTGTNVFTGASKTYYNLWDAQASGTLTITGSNNFNNITQSISTTLKLTASTTTTVASYTADGTGGTITLSSDTPASSAALAKSGGGTVYLDRCSIQDIAASPASTWNARSSTNVSGNSGITFIPGKSNFMYVF